MRTRWRGRPRPCRCSKVKKNNRKKTNKKMRETARIYAKISVGTGRRPAPAVYRFSNVSLSAQQFGLLVSKFGGMIFYGSRLE